MASARLIKAFEKEGFFLEFPAYSSKEELIIEILKENNPRMNLGLPLFLIRPFDYKEIIKEINKEHKKELDKAIIISERIYAKEKIENNLKEIIKENNIDSFFQKKEKKEIEKEFDNFYSVFKEAKLEESNKGQKMIEKQSKLRLNLDLNKSLKTLFSPAKIRIMEKIFNHQLLTNTELKYYYKAISNINKSVLNPGVEDYLRIIELSKKNT